MQLAVAAGRRGIAKKAFKPAMTGSETRKKGRSFIGSKGLEGNG